MNLLVMINESRLHVGSLEVGNPYPSQKTLMSSLFSEWYGRCAED